MYDLVISSLIQSETSKTRNTSQALCNKTMTKEERIYDLFSISYYFPSYLRNFGMFTLVESIISQVYSSYLHRIVLNIKIVKC